MPIVIILALTGFLLIFLEFFLPGAIMGIGGALLLIASITILLLNQPSAIFFGLYFLSLIAILFILIRFALRRVKATSKKGTLYLANDQGGFQASFFQKEMIGRKGIAATDLKPSGHIYLNNQSLQATANGTYIEKGSPIEVIGGEGSRLIVKLITKV